MLGRVPKLGPLARARKRARARLSILQKFLREIDQLGAAVHHRLAKITELGSILGNEASERFGGASWSGVAASQVG